MSGGQHRNDEANGPSRSGERETERSRKAREPSTKPATAQIHGCAQENKKLRQNALDGADFVRDVTNIYPEIPPNALIKSWGQPSRLSFIELTDGGTRVLGSSGATKAV